MDNSVPADGKSSKIKTALGKGLRMLIPPAESGKNGFRQIPVDLIIPNRYQPRKSFDPETLSSLAASLKDNGILQPIIVRREENGRFELIAGERRWRAAQLAGFTEISALVKDAKEQDLMEWALLENVQREDLNPIEKAQAFSRLVTDFSLTQDEIATKIGVDRSTVANILRLLNLPEVIQREISEGSLSTGHAKVILSFQGEEKQIIFAEMIKAHGWNVRQAEANVRRTKHVLHDQKSIEKDLLSNRIIYIQESLIRVLETQVAMKHKRGIFQLRIKYHSTEELKAITDKFSRKTQIPE